MPIFLVLFFFTCSWAEDFITPMEYAKMLYQNPRGIGCHKCHGLRGEGKVIAKYKKNGKQKILKAPSINNIPKKKFAKALRKTNSIMPTYFLTKYEVESLYYYVSQNSKK